VNQRDGEGNERTIPQRMKCRDVKLSW